MKSSYLKYDKSCDNTWLFILSWTSWRKDRIRHSHQKKKKSDQRIFVFYAPFQYFDQAPVVQTLDSAIQRINIYSVDSAIGFPNTYPLGSDLSDG